MDTDQGDGNRQRKVLPLSVEPTTNFRMGVPKGFFRLKEPAIRLSYKGKRLKWKMVHRRQDGTQETPTHPEKLWKFHTKVGL
ncbi:Dimethylglycine Dehydrogenase [Manis pentadactyla]|nr:Dimethylglycine Dehydrogenase [Manis pentadactyla]